MIFDTFEVASNCSHLHIVKVSVDLGDLIYKGNNEYEFEKFDIKIDKLMALSEVEFRELRDVINDVTIA